MTFLDLAVPEALVSALAKQQITAPTAIQAAALPVLQAGRDAYLHAETGTGKTLAYLLPLFARLDPAQESTQIVIVAPTHELAIQIQRQCTDLAQNAGMPVRVLLLIGGTSMERQLDKLKKKPHVVVGSPGRIRELIQMKKLKTPAIRAVVVDEADRLLFGESLPDVRAIVQAAPAGRQLVFASATEPRDPSALATLSPALEVLNAGTAAVNASIEHLYVVCEEREKPDVLRRLVHALNPDRAIAFVHRSGTAEELAAKLAHHKIAVADLHGASDKLDRKQAMDDIRAGRVQVMIASDLAARGLDIPGVTHVFNLDVPTLSQAYLHRVGRTGRAGARGQAVTLATEHEVKLVHRWESELGITVQRVRLREGRVLAAGERE